MFWSFPHINLVLYLMKYLVASWEVLIIRKSLINKILFCYYRPTSGNKCTICVPVCVLSINIRPFPFLFLYVTQVVMGFPMQFLIVLYRHGGGGPPSCLKCKQYFMKSNVCFGNISILLPVPWHAKWNAPTWAPGHTHSRGFVVRCASGVIKMVWSEPPPQPNPSYVFGPMFCASLAQGNWRLQFVPLQAFHC